MEAKCTSQRVGISSSRGRRDFARIGGARRHTGEGKQGGKPRCPLWAARGSHAEPSLIFVVMRIERARRHEAVRLV